MADLNVHKVSSLPAQPRPNAIYFLDIGGGRYQQYVTSANGEYLSEASADGVSPFTAVAFEYNNAAQRVIYTFAASGKIFSVRIHVTEAFDGENPSVAVGTFQSPQSLASNSDSDIAQAVEFEISCFQEFSTGDEIILTVNPGAGATSGAGFIILEIVF